MLSSISLSVGPQPTPTIIELDIAGAVASSPNLKIKVTPPTGSPGSVNGSVGLSFLEAMSLIDALNLLYSNQNV